MQGEEWLDPNVEWLLLYTKAHAEVWAEINLRNQGFLPLLPRIRSRSGFAPLFPRYLFVGVRGSTPATALRNTLGVSYVVQCGAHPARVPNEVIAEVTSRMNDAGVVHLEPRPSVNPLFAKRQQERTQALAMFAAAGFRLKSA